MACAELFNSSEHLPDVFTQPLYNPPVKQALHVNSPSYKGSSPRVSHGHTQSQLVTLLESMGMAMKQGPATETTLGFSISTGDTTYQPHERTA